MVLLDPICSRADWSTCVDACFVFQLDATIDICSCLSTFSNLLKLRETPTLRGLVAALVKVSTPLTGVSESIPTADGERELEDSDPAPGDPELRSSILMLDNIHIRLTKVHTNDVRSFGKYIL